MQHRQRLCDSGSGAAFSEELAGGTCRCLPDHFGTAELENVTVGDDGSDGEEPPSCAWTCDEVVPEDGVANVAEVTVTYTGNQVRSSSGSVIETA